MRDPPAPRVRSCMHADQHKSQDQAARRIAACEHAVHKFARACGSARRLHWCVTEELEQTGASRHCFRLGDCLASWPRCLIDCICSALLCALQMLIERCPAHASQHRPALAWLPRSYAQIWDTPGAPGRTNVDVGPRARVDASANYVHSGQVRMRVAGECIFEDE